jgi:hypothetical protein
MNENFLLYLLGLVIIYIIYKLSAKFLKLLIIITASFVFLTFLNGCSKGNLNNGSSIEDVHENTLTRIKDMPFVLNSKLNIEESLLLGEGKSWSGQLLMTVPSAKAEVFNFYVKNLGEYNWKEQTTIRGKTSILNYVGENNRVAIITIKEDGYFNKSSVLISVSPYTEEFEDKIGDLINEKYLEITEN